MVEGVRVDDVNFVDRVSSMPARGFVRSSSTGRTTWTGDGPGSRGCGT